MNALTVNPFTVSGAPAWLLGLSGLSDHSNDKTMQLEEQGLQQLALLLSRLLEVAESDPALYEALPWLRNVSLWELLLTGKEEARFPHVPYVPRLSRFSHCSDPSNPLDLPDTAVSDMALPKARARGTAMPVTAAPGTAAILLTFFGRVTQPIADMIEALYLSPLLRDTRTVWEILRRMAWSAGVKPLPKDVVVALCASFTRNRLTALAGCRPRPHLAIWKITCRRIPLRLQWPTPAQPKQPARSHDPLSELSRSNTRTAGPGRVGRPARARRAAGTSLLILVREVITHKAGVGYHKSGKVLAFRCIPVPIANSLIPNGVAETRTTAMKLALYDALLFPRSRDGQFNRHIYPPTLLCVQGPVPRGIREAAHVWGIQVEEAERELEKGWDCECECECECEWELEMEMAGRVLDPVHYMRILDRGFERTYGYAPFLTKQRTVHHQGGRWHMRPGNDPLLNYAGLRKLLPSLRAVVGDDGTIEWQGRHYRDFEEDVLKYFPGVAVTIRPSPLAEAAILIYWRGSVLCYAIAGELRHEDGSYRPYSFPYPRLGK